MWLPHSSYFCSRVDLDLYYNKSKPTQDCFQNQVQKNCSSQTWLCQEIIEFVLGTITLSDKTITKSRLSPYLGIFFGILAVSTASIFIRYAQEDVPSLVIAAYRLGLATIFLFIPVLLKYRQEILSLHRNDFALMGLSGVFLALHFASWITSLEYTTVVSSVVLVTTTPLWVALLAPLILRESINRLTWLGLIIALGGGLIIGISSACQLSAGELQCQSFAEIASQGTYLGNFLALFGAWMAAGYLIVGRKIRKNLSVVSYVFLVYGVAAVLLISISMIAGYPFFGYPQQAYLWLFLLALIPQLIGHTTFNWALAYLPASYVAVTLLGEPIGSTILAIVLLNETPTILNMIGAILILIGIVLASQAVQLSSRVGKSASME